MTAPPWGHKPPALHCPYCTASIERSPSGQIPAHVGTKPGRLCKATGWCTVTDRHGRVALPASFWSVSRGTLSD